MAEIIDFKVKNDSKFKKFMRDLKWKAIDVKDYVIEHKETVIPAAIGAIGTIGTITKVVGKRVTLSKEQRIKDRYIYDRSLGRYVEVKRKLNQKDLANIAKRKKDGERVTDILLDMNLVK